MMGAPTSTTNGGSTTTTTTNGSSNGYAISNSNGSSSTNGKGVDLFANMPEVSPNLFGHPSDDSQRPRSRPTRESVLKRLYEALMRRSLTKVRYMIVYYYFTWLVDGDTCSTQREHYCNAERCN